ncbi:MAG: polysaccharide biosynthesis/export family protein [Cyanobacteria bacterium P01_D01_bin.156]
MSSIDPSKPVKPFRDWYTKVTAHLIFSTVCWYCWQNSASAQLDALPPASSNESTVDVVPTIPRPDLGDLDSRTLERSTEQVEDPGFNDSEFDQYRLGPGDGIFVSVQRFPDLAFQATLDQQGNIIVPIEGAIPMAGLTLNEAANRIRAVYNQYVILAEIRSLYENKPALVNQIEGLSYSQAEKVLNREISPSYQELRSLDPQRYRVPDVTLALTAQRGVEVVMLGEIERPGLYPLAVPRVSAALLAAGGARTTADLREIRIQRQLPEGTIEKTLDLYTPIREGQPLPEDRLENGDIIIIPRLDPAQAYDYDVNFVSRSTLAQPEIIVRVINYPRGVIGGQRLPNGSTFVDALVGDSVRGGGGLGLPLTQANLRSVALIRFDQEQGKPIVTKLNARQAVEGDPTQNPPLRDNDVIVVGRNFINRITFTIDTITRPFQDILSFLLFFDSLVDNDLFNGDN